MTRRNPVRPPARLVAVVVQHVAPLPLDKVDKGNKEEHRRRDVPEVVLRVRGKVGSENSRHRGYEASHLDLVLELLADVTEERPNHVDLKGAQLLNALVTRVLRGHKDGLCRGDALQSLQTGGRWRRPKPGTAHFQRPPQAVACRLPDQPTV